MRYIQIWSIEASEYSPQNSLGNEKTASTPDPRASGREVKRASKWCHQEPGLWSEIDTCYQISYDAPRPIAAAGLHLYLPGLFVQARSANRETYCFVCVL